MLFPSAINAMTFASISAFCSFLYMISPPPEVKHQAHFGGNVPGATASVKAQKLLAGVFTEGVFDVVGLDGRLCDLREFLLRTYWSDRHDGVRHVAACVKF